MSTDAPAVSELLRDELADEVDDLRDRVEMLESVIQVPEKQIRTK